MKILPARVVRQPFIFQCRRFTLSSPLYQTPESPEQPPAPTFKSISKHVPINYLAHRSLKNHPQAPVATTGFGPWTRNADTGKRLSFKEREEEKAKEYLYSEPDPNMPLPPLLLIPPGLTDPPVQGKGHGIETRTWWQREFEIWFGRYQKPFDVQAQLARHRKLNSYHTEWSPKADRRSVRNTHGKFFMSPHAFFRADRAKYAPNFSGMTIGPSIIPFESAVYAGSKKATLVGFFSTQMAARMVKPYLEAVENAFPSDPSVGVVRVQFEDNWAKYALIRYYIMSRHLRPQYTPKQQSTYILTQKFVNRPEGEATHITNTQVGYVLLLDSESRIRWMATGMPWPGELEALVKGIGRMVGRESILPTTEPNDPEENGQASREATNYAA